MWAELMGDSVEPQLAEELFLHFHPPDRSELDVDETLYWVVNTAVIAALPMETWGTGTRLHT